MASARPDPLQGLLDDSLTDLLDGFLPSDGDLGTFEAPSMSCGMPYGGFVPNVPSQDFAARTHACEPADDNLGAQCDDASLEHQGSRKRSNGSGE
jgi:hypothetical protein